MAGTCFSHSNFDFLMLYYHHPVKMNNIWPRLLQTEQSALEVLLRKLQDVVVDFTSAIPVSLIQNSQSINNDGAGFAWWDNTYDARTRTCIHCQIAHAASLYKEHTGTLWTFIVEHACWTHTHEKVRICSLLLQY
jgi:hypothetical protein